ncbi:MAG: hypothetical protein ACLGI2_16215 [Acidimicrobiia bacterium]
MAAVLVLLGAISPAAADYPDPLPDFAHPGDPHQGLYSFTGGRTDRPMLVIYAEFADLSFADTSPPGLDAFYTSERYFGAFPSVADYFDDDSSGQLRFSRARESDASNNGAVDDGVVSVSIPMAKSDFLALGLTTGQKRLLEAADPFVDFAAFDADGNGRVTQDELVVHRQDVDPDAVGPGCATARRPDAVELDGVQLGGGGNLLMVNAGTDTNLITLAHETGHAAFDMPDLYFWNVGALDLGGPTCSRPDTSLFRANAWQKMHLGWIAPTVVTRDGYYVVPLTADANSAFILYDPDKGSDDYFVVENRAEAAGTYDQGASDTGLVIWRLEDSAFTPNGAGEGELGPDGGFIALMPPSGDQAWDPSDPATPDRTMADPWRDGTPSNVAVRAIPPASGAMRVFFDVRGPGVLVDPTTAEGRPIRVDVTPEEQNRPHVRVMNTGEVTAGVRTDYEGLPAGWTSAADVRSLEEHQEALVQPVIVPAADAPTGVRQVTIAGRHDDDATIGSSASFEVNVVLDRTQVSYTGPVKAPTGEPVTLSATVANPDDAGTPPVAGVEVTFALSGPGGTQTATATTGADGTASATTTLDLPPGDYDLTVSTPRQGKHAPTSATVGFRVPTAAERVEDLRAAVDEAGLHPGTQQSLTAKLESALRALGAERAGVACNLLRAFVNEVSAQPGKKITASVATALVAEAEGIRRQLGC